MVGLGGMVAWGFILVRGGFRYIYTCVFMQGTYRVDKGSCVFFFLFLLRFFSDVLLLYSTLYQFGLLSCLCFLLPSYN